MTKIFKIKFIDINVNEQTGELEYIYSEPVFSHNHRLPRKRKKKLRSTRNLTK